MSHFNKPSDSLPIIEPSDKALTAAFRLNKKQLCISFAIKDAIMTLHDMHIFHLPYQTVPYSALTPLSTMALLPLSIPAMKMQQCITAISSLSQA
jgi:hypothetical protein